MSVEEDIWDRVDLAQSKQTTAGEERVVASATLGGIWQTQREPRGTERGASTPHPAGLDAICRGIKENSDCKGRR